MSNIIKIEMDCWENLVISSPPMLRRSTHHHCVYCGTNLEVYRQEACTGCLLPLGEDEGMVVMGSELRKGMGWFRRLRLGIRSIFLRVRARVAGRVGWFCPLGVKRGRVYRSM